jgi:DNA-binding transcriptional LysR family regulator
MKKSHVGSKGAGGGGLVLMANCRQRRPQVSIVDSGAAPWGGRDVIRPRKPVMHWRSFDLNLLVIFDAVMQDRSVTRAGTRLGMSQPAISHALGRLRHALKDKLFIRTPEGMEPTARAERLANPVRQALQGLLLTLEDAELFVPAEAEQTFAIALNNDAALVMAAPLAARAAAEAPGIVLDLRPSGALDLTDRLGSGELALALGPFAAPSERFADLRLLEDRFVAVLRRGHPAAGADGSVTMDGLATLSHLVISSTGEGTDLVDAELAKFGLTRRVALRAPLLAAAEALVRTDMVAVLSERAAREFARSAALQVLALPSSIPTLMTAMLWHRRFDDLPAHRWLRSLVLRVARTLKRQYPRHDDQVAVSATRSCRRGRIALAS